MHAHMLHVLHACMHAHVLHACYAHDYIQLLIAILLCAYLAKHYFLNLESVCYNQ